MKNIIFAVLTLIGSILSLSAQETLQTQEQKQSIGYELYSGFLSIPLNPNNLTSNINGVSLVYSLSNSVNMKIGLSDRQLKQTDFKVYENHVEGLLGLGYFIPNKKISNFDTEVNLSFANSFNQFGSFKDYHTDLGFRFYMFRSFYVGTGFIYSHNETGSFISAPTNSLNWFWQLGLRLNLQRKQ